MYGMQHACGGRWMRGSFLWVMRPVWPRWGCQLRRTPKQPWLEREVGYRLAVMTEHRQIYMWNTNCH